MGNSSKLSDEIIARFGMPFNGNGYNPETYSGFEHFRALTKKDQTIGTLAKCILEKFPSNERNIFGSSTYAVALEFSESEDYKNLSTEAKDYISGRGGIWTENTTYSLRDVLTAFC